MNFNFSANPALRFGPGTIGELPEITARYGKKLLLITGSRSFRDSGQMVKLLRGLKDHAMEVFTEIVASEPSPELIDTLTGRYRSRDIQVVAAVGGGSVMDSGKAVSAMLTKKEGVTDFLEGVGTLHHDGQKIPFIAVPTTAGTGSEATKNAVLAKVGRNGFKKSLRHEGFIPDVAIVDPELTRHCPIDVTVACGMDAVTQLLESLMSTKASWMTETLSMGALEVMGDALMRLATGPSDDLELRSRMCYASYISGVTLANAGLGLVHGFAAAIGGLIDIPHGVVCGTLVAEVIKRNVEMLIKIDPTSRVLGNACRAAGFLDKTFTSRDPVDGARHLAAVLGMWTDRLKLAGLSEYGFRHRDIQRVVNAAGQKNNPVSLPVETMAKILEARL